MVDKCPRSLAPQQGGGGRQVVTQGSALYDLQSAQQDCAELPPWGMVPRLVAFLARPPPRAPPCPLDKTVPQQSSCAQASS